MAHCNNYYHNCGWFPHMEAVKPGNALGKRTWQAHLVNNVQNSVKITDKCDN